MRPSTAIAIVGWLVTSSLAADQDVVRTADPVKRGLKESDFPRSIELADNVYAYEDLRSAGDERFTTVSLYVITSDGVLVADGQASVDATKRLVDEIGRKTQQPIKYVVICSDHGDHTGGNSVFPASAKFFAHPTSRKTLEDQARAPNRRQDAPPVVVPTVTVPETLALKVGDTEIQILFLGRAHTGGDLSVYLPKEKILFMSEAFLNQVFPAMRSAYPSEWVEVVRKAQNLDVRTYVPGHGFVEQPAASREELENARKALELVIATVKKLHDAGVPVEDAIKKVEWGPYRDWRISRQQGPIAVRKIYEELAGKLK
jgi:glyoxylase-like metal-dependent hydrolase (beta-lactamase superfamily II)